MSIHYKFKAAKDFDTVSFDGAAISLAELKNRIIDAKGLGKPLDFDLAIHNAQTNEEYINEAAMIPRNTSVIIRRVPVTRPAGQPPSKLMSSSAPLIPAASAMPSLPKPPAAAAAAPPPAVMPMAPKPAAPLDPNKTDAERMRDVINQSGGWHQRPQMRQPFNRFNKPYSGHNVPPPNYICYRCNHPFDFCTCVALGPSRWQHVAALAQAKQEPGHYISDCPTNGDPAYDVHKVKKATGIPRSFLKPVAQAGDAKSTLLLPNGSFAVMQPNSRDFLKVQVALTSKIEREKIPIELQCNLCQDLLREAVSTPCCNFVFCDECIRHALIEPAQGLASLTCPNCRSTGISPDQLQPNKAVRDKVEAYRIAVPQQALKSAVASAPPMAAGRSIPTVDLSDEQQLQPLHTAPARPMDITTLAITAEFDNEPSRRRPIAARHRDDNAIQSLAGDGGEVDLIPQESQAHFGPSAAAVAPPPRALPKGKPTDLCYNCRQYGHFARDCPMPPSMPKHGEANIDKHAYVKSLVETAVAYFVHTPRDPPPTKGEIEQYREQCTRHYEQQMASWQSTAPGRRSSPPHRGRSRSPSRKTPPREYKPLSPSYDRHDGERRRSRSPPDRRREPARDPPPSSRDRERDRGASDRGRGDREWRREDRESRR